jgi:hypothetical protein
MTVALALVGRRGLKQIAFVSIVHVLESIISGGCLAKIKKTKEENIYIRA